jgi:hypothetical protein
LSRRISQSLTEILAFCRALGVVKNENHYPFWNWPEFTARNGVIELVRGFVVEMPLQCFTWKWQQNGKRRRQRANSINSCAFARCHQSTHTRHPPRRRGKGAHIIGRKLIKITQLQQDTHTRVCIVSVCRYWFGFLQAKLPLFCLEVTSFIKQLTFYYFF